MTEKPENQDAAPQAPAATEAERSDEPESGAPARPLPLIVTVLLVVLSLLIALGILVFVGWLTGDRLASGGSPVTNETARVDPLGPVVLPEGSKMVPRVFPGAGEAYAEKMLTMARVPGDEAAVRDFFVRQAADMGWKCAARPPKTEGGGITLIIESGDEARMMTIREHPSGKECTVGVYDFAGE